ncbi:hypothetical protein C8R46DRAFT_1074265 [Mycena filopes]|nr:hypothetical protein C8R46DRAFT_1074265 [Mycena filopes]
MNHSRPISLILWALSDGLAGAHVSRQIDIPSPPQCDSSCDPINTIAQGGYFDCLKCVGVADNATTADFAIAQTDLDDFTVACSKVGFALPELTLPGQNPNRTLATAPVSGSGSPSSAKSVSQITIATLPSDILSNPPPSSTLSQKTVTSVPLQSPTSSPAGPTTTPNTAVHAFEGLGMAVGFLVAVVTTACMMF